MSIIANFAPLIDMKQELARSKPINIITNNQTLLKNHSKGKQIKSNKFKGCSLLENRLRKLLERHFQCEFPNVRLPFLRNPLTNRLLELDLYSSQLKLAIEIDGIFHRTSNSHFYKEKDGKTIEDQFKDQQYRDQLKHRLCKENGIKLVVVHDSEINKHMLDDELLSFVLNKIAFA